MTDWVENLTKETKELLNTTWDVRDGTVIPESDTVALADGAVRIDATFLYADLAASSKLAEVCPWETTAKIIRAYLHIAIRLIRAYQGEIRSFDGDRVMGVFMGDTKNTNAVRCAREIFWMTENVLDPEATSKFTSIKNNNIRIRQCVGIDTGTSVAVRAGIRNNNDLVWIGRPPSLAAKLSDVREYPYCVVISDASFKKLGDADKKDGDKDIWEKRSIKFGGNDVTIHRTNWMRKP
ncbi:adenylate cyclase [Bradyrhizobium sp. USDA 4341]